jgi:hypothetical protein
MDRKRAVLFLLLKLNDIYMNTSIHNLAVAVWHFIITIVGTVLLLYVGKHYIAFAAAIILSVLWVRTKNTE